jgi:FKBP-type peptidyl-prolyl cis-trans isomerase FkpA/FKBP-type peptidyl-prolyl cis-trans isomerase FklB
VGAAIPAYAADPKSEDEKVLYAMGLVISQNVAWFNLTEAELKMVEQGLADGVLNKTKKVDLAAYGPKIQDLQRTRLTAVMAAEKKAGQAFVDKAATEKGATKTASGFVITTLKAGSGPQPVASDKVKVHYHGTLTDGTVFDSSVQRGEPMTLPLDKVIRCWSEGVQQMKVGGKSKLVCPSDVAYGDQGRAPRIKPGATLVFEIELLGIEK